MKEMNIADYKPFTMVDGEGIRCSLYVSGCVFNCVGCYNKVAQDFNYGSKYTQELEDRIMADLSHSHVQGLSILGGEPFLFCRNLNPLLERVKRELPDKDIWCWTGYTWEELLESELKWDMVSYIDVLIDGRFEIDKRNLDLQFRGSSNQRVIDCKKSFESEDIVLWDKLLK